MKTKLNVRLAAVLVAAASIPAGAQPPGQAGPPGMPVVETLTLERAIEIAVQQQPALRQTRAQIEAANGRVDLARVARAPTANLGASLNTGSTRPGADLFTGGFFTPHAGLALTASASWRIYDFGQTSSNIRAAELNARATTATLDTASLDVRTGVELAYLEAVARGRLVKVAETTMKSEDLHLDQARRFVAAQAKDPIELAQAQSRAANARSAYAQAQALEAISLANLRAAIGWLDPTRSPSVTGEWPTPPTAEPPLLMALVETARHRPELRQLDLQIQASQASLDAALRERRPVLSASAATQWQPDTSDPTPQPSWQASLTLSWALFDGGRAKADQRIARANVAGALANRDALLVQLTTQLDASRSQIIANKANVAASTEAVTAARAQLRLAEARYAQGLGSQIELADAQVAVTTAEGNLVSAEFQLATAWATLHRATAAG
ncbi:MAG: TolC family protein [Deltaproteobacteria bacterium]|nr:TolC family protein [Deltaproteobacteria bacterium]